MCLGLEHIMQLSFTACLFWYLDSLSLGVPLVAGTLMIRMLSEKTYTLWDYPFR